MKSEKRKPRGLLGMLAADPYRKLGAVALAVGLWFFLNSQITRDLPLRMQLATIGTVENVSAPFNRRIAVVLPTDRVIGKQFYDGDKPIDSVQVTLSGPRYLIDNKEDERLDLRINKFVGNEWSSRNPFVEFTAEDVQRDVRSLQGVRIAFDPPRVRLEVEPIDFTEERVQLDDVELLQLDPEVEQRLRRDTARFSPETIRILGPKSSLAKLSASTAKMLRARFSPASNARETTAALELNAPPELGLRLAERPSLTIQLMPVTKVFQLELPIQVDDLALAPALRGLYRPEHPTESVGVRAGGALRALLVSQEASEEKLQEWARTYLRLEVWIEPPGGGADYGPELVREARLRLRGPMQATVEPGDYALDQTLSVRLHRKP